MGDEPDGLNINLGVGSTNIDTLCNFVKSNCLDIGFAFDGDADRCLCVDEKGRVVDGDKILYIAAKYMKKKEQLKGDCIVSTIMSNIGLDKALEKVGVRNIRTQVGDRFVYEEIKKGGYGLGGEQSGHIIFSSYATTGDGLLTSLKIMEILMSEKVKLSELISDFTEYPQVIINVATKNKLTVIGCDSVKCALKKAEQRLDGKGRVLLRASGTENLVRVMVEAESEVLCIEVAENLADEVRRSELIL
jgi:phosphoglucosamine mutase